MATGYRVQVYRSNIARVMKVGDGNRWIYRVSIEMMRAARAEAPSRTSALKRAHRVTRGIGTNQYMARYHIVNDAEHAEWVHEGTSTIYSPKKMRVPRRPNPLRGAALPNAMTRPRSEVRGQAANPWLDRACTRVSLRYGAVAISL